MKQVIGITGGVGAGKSRVLQILKEDFGARVILTDQVAHDLMEKGEQGWQKIRDALGAVSYTHLDVYKRQGYIYHYISGRRGSTFC